MALHQTAIHITQSAEKTSEKIKNQSLIFEAIKSETNKQALKINKNVKVFEQAVGDLDRDK